MVDGTYATIYDLLFSVTKTTNIEIIDYVLSQLDTSEDLDTDEIDTLKTFHQLYNETKMIPSSGTLVSRNIAFTTAKTIDEKSLEDFVNIFISNKKKMKFATRAMNILTDVNKPGDTLSIAKEKLLELINDSYTTDEMEIESSSYGQETLEKIISKDKPESGVPLGIDFVDGLYPGLIPRSFNIIAGYTASMKTTLALNQCFIGMQMGYNMLYLSLEISEEEAIISLMSLYSISCTNEPITRDNMNKLRYTDKDKFTNIFNGLMGLPGKIQIFDESKISSYSVGVFNEIIRKTEKKLIEDTGNGIYGIVLDHAQLLKFDEKLASADPYMVLNRYASFFRQLAAKRNYAVTLVSQTSRGGYEYACKHGGQYLLTGLAESNELERGATFVLTIFNSDELRASGQIQVQVLKNRYGEVMLEPQPVSVRPEYYLIGGGYKENRESSDIIFNSGDTPFNPFIQVGDNNQNIAETSLEDLLGGM